MTLWGTVLITVLLIFTHFLMFVWGHRSGFKKGAQYILEKWKNFNKEMGAQSLNVEEDSKEDI